MLRCYRLEAARCRNVIFCEGSNKAAHSFILHFFSLGSGISDTGRSGRPAAGQPPWSIRVSLVHPAPLFTGERHGGLLVRRRHEALREGRISRMRRGRSSTTGTPDKHPSPHIMLSEPGPGPQLGGSRAQKQIKDTKNCRKQIKDT